MALERFCWGPSLDLLRDLRNGLLWLEHCIGSGGAHWFKSFFLLSDSYTSCLYCNIVPVFSCLLDSDNRPGKKEQPSNCALYRDWKRFCCH